MFPYQAVADTVSTLDNEIVEEIRPGRRENPDNVRRVEFIVTEENFNDLFPRRNKAYTYRRLLQVAKMESEIMTKVLQAIGKFPAVCGYVGKEDKSDAICRKTLLSIKYDETNETNNEIITTGRLLPPCSPTSPRRQATTTQVTRSMRSGDRFETL